MSAPRLTLSISGQPVKPHFNSIQIAASLNQRDTCDFVVITHTPTVAAYLLGQRVEITDGGTVNLFAGRIEKISQATVPVKNIVNDKWWSIGCVSHDKLLDRFFVTGSWTGETMGAIVRKLIGTYVAADGMTTSNVEDGPVIPQYDVTSPTRLSDVIADLSRLTKYPYYVELIDGSASPIHTDLHMFDPTSGATVFSLTDGTGVETIDPHCDMVAYRNRQYVLTGKGATTEEFAGSGTAPQTVTVSAQISSVKSIEVDGDPKMVGITGDTGKDWYYTVNGTDIVQDASAPDIPTTSKINVLYLPRRTDTLHGDGATNPITLHTSKPITFVSEITLNGGAPLAVGILGTEDAALNDWLYTPNGTTIQQGTGGSTLLLADDLFIDYEPVTGFIMKENTAEQTYRASIEGGSGIHEFYDNAVAGGTEDDADALCTELLAKYGVSNPGSGRLDVRELNFRVNTAIEPTAVAFRPGKRVAVNRASIGVVGNMLISSVNISELPGTYEIVFDTRLTRDRFIPDFEPFYDQQPVAAAASAGSQSGDISGVTFNGVAI